MALIDYRSRPYYNESRLLAVTRNNAHVEHARRNQYVIKIVVLGAAVLNVCTFKKLKHSMNYLTSALDLR